MPRLILPVFFQDLRFALRVARTTPGITLVASLSLALAVGANTTVFTLANSFLLRALPVDRPEQLLRVHSTINGEGFYNISYTEYTYYRDHSRTCAGLVAFFPMITMALQSARDPETVTGEIVSANYFDVLGIKPVLGRGFRADDEEPAVVFAYSFWAERFGGDPAIIGRSIRLNGRPFTVIGVGPRAFAGTFAALSSQLWVPVRWAHTVFPQLGNLHDPNARLLMGVGRLLPTATLAQARAEFATLAAQLRAAYPAANRDRGVNVVPATGIHPALARPLRVFFTLLLAVVSLMLIVACANVASLLLARGAQRAAEFAARRALGASRARLVMQLLAEALVLAFFAGALGLMISVAAVRVFPHFLPVLPFHAALDLRPDVHVLVYTFVLVFVVTVLIAVVPAFRASRADVMLALRATPRHTRMSGLLGREVLVGVQVAVSVVLLISAGLLVRTLRYAELVKPGFDGNGVLTATTDVELLGYSEPQGRAFYNALLARMSAVSGIEHVALAAFVPLSGQGDAIPITAAEGTTISAGYNVVTLEYFAALRIPLLYGQGFANGTDQDCVVLNTAAVHLLWPQRTPAQAIGASVRIEPDHVKLFRVVGVVPTGKYTSLGEAERPFIYRPAAGAYRPEMTMHVRARPGVRPDTVAATLRRTVRDLDPQLPIANLGPMNARLGFALTPARIAGTILISAATVVLVLTSMGVYAVASFSVSRRVRELGIRLALGAPFRTLRMQTITRGMRSVVAGLLAGMLLASGVTRSLRSLLIGVAPSDPVTVASVLVLVLIIGATGYYVPVHRALALDPGRTLRYE